MSTIIQCPLIPKGICINLFGTFWTRDSSWIDRFVINHERIHTAQQHELLFIPFYILYILEWLVRLIRYRNFHKAYLNISFEREAYANGHNLAYLPSRRPFAWCHYIIAGGHTS
ncbi:MAG: hypothetical protein NC342_00685 [Pseudoflavonifractor sp.]|nr:hypothetical protein [Alloprevotella sp.]MCM1116042.1 hypothetical protein [Pseudoflavonifractor sp.]